jgi:hypothetical protein
MGDGIVIGQGPLIILLVMALIAFQRRFYQYLVQTFAIYYISFCVPLNVVFLISPLAKSFTQYKVFHNIIYSDFL